MNHPIYMQSLEDLGDAPHLTSGCDILHSDVCRAPWDIHCENMYGLQLLIFMVCQKANLFYIYFFFNREME